MDGRLPDVSQVSPSIAGEANNTKESIRTRQAEKQTTPRSLSGPARQRSKQHQGAYQDPPGRLSSDLRIHELKKNVGDGEGKRKCHARQCKM